MDSKSNNKVPSEKVYSKMCMDCKETPCFLEQTCSAFMSSDLTLYTTLIEQGDEMMKSNMTNSEIRYALYRTAALFCFGNLGAGHRKELPPCIVVEIRDAFPAASGTSYIGFKPTSAPSK